MSNLKTSPKHCCDLGAVSLLIVAIREYTKLKLMPKRERLVGRPPKEIEDKLCKSINIKLTIDDYCNIIDRAERLNITPTAYARQLVVSGKVVSPFSAEELQILRALAGEANNLNQIAKHLNSGEMQYKLTACAVIIKLKKILDDSKKY